MEKGRAKPGIRARINMVDDASSIHAVLL